MQLMFAFSKATNCFFLQEFPVAPRGFMIELSPC